MGEAAIDWRNIKHELGPRDLRVEPRVLLRVEVEPERTSVGGQDVPHGVHHILVYRSEVPDVMKKVRTAEQVVFMEHCVSMFESELQTYARESGMTLEAAKVKIPSSPQEHFTKRYRGGMPPLKSCKVVEDNLPPPDSLQARAEAAENRQASAFEKLAGTIDRLVQQNGRRQG